MFLEMIKSIVLGIVEGISEWLPISSTGHMILVNELINNTEGFTASDLYLYVIQIQKGTSPFGVYDCTKC